jgi:hypothetical protein
MIHGNTLHSPTYFQAVVLKGAAEVGNCLFLERQKKMFYTIALRCTVHVIKASADYSDLIRRAEACCVASVMVVFL